MRNSDAALKPQILAAFRRDPDFAITGSLHRASASQQRSLLRWFDESGLALYFLNNLRQHAVVDRLPATFREALELRLTSNRTRTADMFEEFRRILTAFRHSEVRFCALKGFSLVPDFCPAPHLRHQTDFDFLIAPESLPQASRALESRGYTQTELRATGQLTFATALLHVPSAQDDIYARPRHREVDLLPTLSQDFHGASVHLANNQLDRVRGASLNGIDFPILASDDAFSLQILHSFGHFLGSWIRLSWLIEIANFLNAHHQDNALWQSVVATQNSHGTNREAFGLILSLTNSLFSTKIPEALDAWCLQPLPTPIAAWVTQFSQRFAAADLHGTKLTLFVHREFFHDRPAWRSYLLTRLFPFGRRSSIGSVSTAASGARIKANVSQWLHSMRRVLFHVRELLSFPMDAIRWKRAVRNAHKQRALVPPHSDPVRTAKPSGTSLAGLARLPD
jgi:hypothetical protein